MLRPKMSRHDHPDWGWVGIAAWVLAVDLTGNQTMSDVFKRASRNKIAGPFVVFGWCYLTAHLFGLLSPRWDLFHRLLCHQSCTLHNRR